MYKPPFAEPAIWDEYQYLQEKCISHLAARGSMKVCIASPEFHREVFAYWSKPCGFACWSKPSPFWKTQKCSKALTLLLLSELFLVALSPVSDEEDQFHTTFQNVFTAWINSIRIFFCVVSYFFPSNCYNTYWGFVHY